MAPTLVSTSIPSPDSEGFDLKTKQRLEPPSQALADDLAAVFSSCCQQGNYAMVQKLLQTNVLLANTSDSSNIPPLHWAALNNRWHICNQLINAGADVNAVNANDKSTALHWAASKGHVAICSLLLDNGAYCLSFDGAGYAPVHIAAQKGHALVLALLVEVNKTCLNALDEFKRTPLLWAAYKGHSATVQMLINMGASVNLIDEGGTTALHWSLISDNSNAELVWILIKAGANPSIKDGTGKTPSDWAQLKGRKWYNMLLESLYLSRSIRLKRLLGSLVLPHIVCPGIAMVFSLFDWKLASIITATLVAVGNIALTKWLMRGTQMVATPFLQHFQWSMIIWPTFIYLSYFVKGNTTLQLCRFYFMEFHLSRICIVDGTLFVCYNQDRSGDNKKITC